jgi:hypothetical protein
MKYPVTERTTPEENSFLEALRQQEVVFESASAFLHELLPASPSASPLDSTAMGDLQRWLSRIAAAQQSANEARLAFGQTSTPLSDAARRELSEREQMLRKFQLTVDQVLEQLQSSRSELVPHLDTEVRRRSMHSAYKASLKTG